VFISIFIFFGQECSFLFINGFKYVDLLYNHGSFFLTTKI